MNIEKLKQARDRVAKADARSGTGFRMSHFFTRLRPEFSGEEFAEFYGSCGTYACIAGHVVDGEPLEPVDFCGTDLDFERAAARILEISRVDARYVFFGRWTEKDLDAITKADALAYLDECIEAGCVVRR